VNRFTISKHGHSRFWAVRDEAGELVCICVYKRGALEVARRLNGEGDCLQEKAVDYARDPTRAQPEGE
jgi:hypothetical protein